MATIVQQEFSLDPFTNALFLFCGRRRDRIKTLYWEGIGFVQPYKRLESGSFQWPRSEAKALTNHTAVNQCPSRLFIFRPWERRQMGILLSAVLFSTGISDCPDY